MLNWRSGWAVLLALAAGCSDEVMEPSPDPNDSEADIAVTVTGPQTAAPGSTITYLITVTNAEGAASAEDVIVTDTLPTGVAVTAVSDNGTEVSGVVVWPPIPALVAGGSQTRSITATVLEEGNLRNVAAATSSTSDSRSSNNDGSGSGAIITVSTAVIEDGMELAPPAWGEGELAQYWAITRSPGSHKEASGTGGLIAATSGPVAIRAGFEALRQGGTAADAVTTTALAQIVLAAGSWVSFAGRITAIYYDAGTGSVQALNANYNVPLNETDPLSIPSSAPSGRTALVPGFMAGIEALHSRYGVLPWSWILGPSIYFAEEGFVLQNDIASLIQARADVLSRLPEAREVFTHPNGRLYQAGDLFRQEALGATLRRVATQGADYMYGGEWGQRLIEILQREGGVMTMEDLKRYEPTWHAPATAELGPYTVHGLMPPNIGGPFATEIFTMIAASDLPALEESYVTSPETLYWLMQFSFIPRIIRSEGALARLKAAIPDLDIGPANLSPETATRLWELMQTPEWGAIRSDIGVGAAEFGSHSDAVVATDAAGNVAAIIHTINTTSWGTTGIFVDGVSIPNSAAIQQPALVAAGPGGRVGDAGPPTLVMRDGEPFLASSATGGNNVDVNWQSIYNVLVAGMTPREAVDQPDFNMRWVRPGDYPASTLSGVEALGQPIRTTSSLKRGFWVGIARDGDGASWQAGVVPSLNGIAIGH